MFKSSDEYNVPLDARLAKRVVRWQVHGSLMADVFDTFGDQNQHWLSLPLDIQNFKWMSEIRMTQGVFYELLQRVEEQMPVARINEGPGSYTAHERFFLTLSFLAHCPTLRYMDTKFGVPNNALSVNILRPTVVVLKAELVTGPDTEIKWPNSIEDQNAAMAAFLLEHGLPGVIGAIDGSLLFM